MKGQKLLFEEHITAALFLVMTVLAGANIVSRVLANFSFAFTEELIVYLFVVVSMFGTSAGVTRQLHMGLTIITDQLTPPLKRAFLILGAVACILLFGILFFQGSRMIISQISYGLKTPILQIPEWWFTLCLPVGSACYIYRMVRTTIKKWKEVGER